MLVCEFSVAGVRRLQPGLQMVENGCTDVEVSSDQSFLAPSQISNMIFGLPK